MFLRVVGEGECICSRGRTAERMEEGKDGKAGTKREERRGVKNKERERERNGRATSDTEVTRGEEDRTRNGVTVTYIMRAPVRAHALHAPLETPRHSPLGLSGALTARVRARALAPTRTYDPKNSQRASCPLFLSIGAPMDR